MTFRIITATTITAACLLAGAATAQDAPLTVSKATVTIDGTSNVHDWTASTSNVRVTRAQVAPDVRGASFWDAIVKPGALQAFEVTIPAASLTSPRSGLDKNMHKALNVQQHPDITFRLTSLSAASTPGAFTAVGTLKVAGVEREVELALTLGRSGDALVVKGTTDLLMTDFGIEPPKALLGTVRSSPKVAVSFQTVLASPLT